MQLRAFSSLCSSPHHLRCYAGFLVAASLACSNASVAQDNAGLQHDPATGVVYRKVQQTIERQVVETQVQTQESTVYRPETVITTRPETRMVHTPVVKYAWEPRMQKGWNPFSQPTVVYQHTPRTHWETKSETINRQETQTNWVAERRKVDVPRQVVRIQREEKTNFEPMGKVPVSPQKTPPDLSESAIASRLRPLDANARVEPLYRFTQPAGSLAGEPPRRDEFQRGMKVNELYPAPSQGYGLPQPPANTGLGVAGLPIPSGWR